MNISLQDICTLVGLTLGQNQVQGKDRLLEDLQAQSLDIAHIATAVERKYDVFLDETVLAKIKTVDDLHRIVQELSPS